ncbi:hypothetical protein Tco_1523998 [Tanacetum coccineum]
MVEPENLMLTSVERRITPFLGLTEVKVKGSPVYSSFPTCETAGTEPGGSGNPMDFYDLVWTSKVANFSPYEAAVNCVSWINVVFHPNNNFAGFRYKNMVMVLDIKIDVDLDFIRHWLDAWSETAICHKESKALVYCNLKVNSTDTNAAAQHEDFMDIDEPSDVATHRPPFAPLLSARELDPFSLLEPSHLGITSSGPFVSHGTNSESRHPESVPRIIDVTDTLPENVP